ncbi:MAG: LarC family nickel insertion protein [Acetobacteraceae bacterium]|nr:LarC family nickel insertion protein [Acetobacteraceae bacterium]
MRTVQPGLQDMELWRTDSLPHDEALSQHSTERAQPMKHLHLDPVGGLAGDMFVAALIDAFPQHGANATGVAQAIAGVPCLISAHRDHVLTGSRFIVLEPPEPGPARDQHRHSSHAHTSWRDIRAGIEGSSLPPGVQRHAVGIFAQLAAAEARVHGIDVEAVTFHEVGSADSIADIVASAWMIEAMGAATWSVGALPLGSGRVQTAHGAMPVPAPATTLLLEGFAIVDDGVPGERVTPTGAAILRYLGCIPRSGLTGRIVRSGIGFGARELPGMSNVLRVLAFEAADTDQPGTGRHRDLGVIVFEVDDQSPEDLAVGLDRVRAIPGVHDVLQMPAFGKKGRMAMHVQILTEPGALDAVVEACFRETTTIGLRTHLVQGRVLARQTREVMVEGARVRVKTVDRPGGRTGKAEADDAIAVSDHAARVRLRREAERMTESDQDPASDDL